jgi:hypothetical protein
MDASQTRDYCARKKHERFARLAQILRSQKTATSGDELLLVSTKSRFLTGASRPFGMTSFNY